MAARAHLEGLRPAGPSSWVVLGVASEVLGRGEGFDALVHDVHRLRDHVHPRLRHEVDALVGGRLEGLTISGVGEDGTPFAVRLDRLDDLPVGPPEEGRLFAVRRAGGEVRRVDSGARAAGPVHAELDRGIDSVLSHDLRGALRQASGFATVARRTLESQAGDDALDLAVEHLGIALRSLGTADAMSSSVVRWLRLGDQPAVVDHHPVERLIERARALLAERQPDAVDRVSVEAGASGLEVVADPELCSMGLVELLDNAVRFWPSDEPIEVSIALDGRWCTVHVVDRGPGFDLDDVDAAFATGRVLQPRGGAVGVGMGLPIARLAARRHGGWCAVHPSDPVGVIAQFSVPVGSPS